jgi:hypothetical protein
VLLSFPAFAAFETIEQSITITSGSATATSTIPFSNGVIREVYVNCPTLDSASTCTVALVLLPFSGSVLTVAPNGWTNKTIGASEDGAIIKCSATRLTVDAAGQLRITLTASDAQEAARVFKLLYIREY